MEMPREKAWKIKRVGASVVMEEYASGKKERAGNVPAGVDQQGEKPNRRKENGAGG